MIHNSPYSLSNSVVVAREFEDVLKDTYRSLDGRESELREYIATAIERFSADPADALQWFGHSVVVNQSSLSMITEIRMVINNSESIALVPGNLEAFGARYRQYVIGWAHQGENCSSSMTNVVSRATLEATADVFDVWGFFAEIERSVARDIEESQKRFVVKEFVDLKVEEIFYLIAEHSAQLYRKLSPRRAVTCVFPVSLGEKSEFSPRDTVYIFRIPQEGDRVAGEMVTIGEKVDTDTLVASGTN